VAIIGVVGALVGALVGGAVTLFGVILQQHSATAAQLQSERQTSYVAYGVAMDNMNGDISGVLLDAKLGLVPTKYVRRVISDNVALAHAADQASIYASPRLLSVIQEQQHTAEFLDVESQGLQARISYPKLPITPGVPLQQTLQAELTSSQNTFQKTEKSYLNVARSDLGTNRP
jgi:hypothetical protein